MTMWRRIVDTFKEGFEPCAERCVGWRRRKC